ncbi:MAG: hypothetical protein NT088_00435 [Candidatus Omnitrophica bacterium]|nr:hypothetical protein [Candidatus Omnitrophota bacterium]
MFLLLLPVFAFAQNIPPGQEPGAESERFRKESEQKKIDLEKKKAKAPEIQVEEEKAPPTPEGQSFLLNDVKVTGSTIFKPEDFKPLYENFIGKKVTYRELDFIINKIKDKYKGKSYLTTSAFLPEQEVKNGVVEIRIIEGKMGELKIEGNKYFSTPLIKKYFHLKKNDLLSIQTLQRDILRLNQNSDLELKATIAKGGAPETTDVILKATEKLPYHAGLSVDNQGTRLVGKYRESLTLRSSNLTGNLDSLFINTLYSGRSFGESVSYTLPIGTNGTKFGLDITYFRMKLGEEYKPNDITGETQDYTPHVSWELALSEDYQANLDVGLEIKSIIKRTSGSQTSDDQLRLPYFGLNFSKMDNYGQTTFAPKMVFGTSGFMGASSRNHPSASRANTGGEFYKYEQYLGRIQRMPFGSYISARSQLQLASRTLPSSEQLQLGGANTIRGYPEGDYLADWGGYISTDWVLSKLMVPSLRGKIEPVVFADVGGGELKKVLPGEKHMKFLAGVGGGLRMHLNNTASLRLDWAQYVGDEPFGGNGPSTFYFSFQSEI